MILSSMEEYVKSKATFIIEHGNSYITDIQHNYLKEDEVSVYRNYLCKDGALWEETIAYDTEVATIKYENTETQLKVNIIKTEFWNSDNKEHHVVLEQRK